jgi:nucleotide-binding universal stress UspA family protein
LLDGYSSAIIGAARSSFDDITSISEEVVLEAGFEISQADRIENREEEKLLLIATVEELLRHDLVIREHTADGPLLVFPYELAAIADSEQYIQRAAVKFTFSGPVASIYSTLVVRLSGTGRFRRESMRSGGAEFSADGRGVCGFALDVKGDAAAALYFYYDGTGAETQAAFEGFIRTHILRRVPAGSLTIHLIYRCGACGEAISDRQAMKRRERGHASIVCPVCEQDSISLRTYDDLRRADNSEEASVMLLDDAANQTRSSAAARLTISGKVAVGEYDVFLSYNGRDRALVRRVYTALQDKGIRPWFDVEALRPGSPWQRILEEEIEQIDCAAVFVGESGVGPWQEQEMRAFLERFVERRCSVIPVLLPSARSKPQLPIFLRGLTWVDLRSGDEEGYKYLIWGITGKKM